MFERTRLSQICELISSGGTPSRKHPEYYTSGKNLWVKSQELRDKPIYDTNEHITDDAVKKSSAKEFPKNTILIAMYGATVGKLGLLKKQATTNQAICGLIINEDIAHYCYVYYAVLQNRNELIAKAFGAAQQNLNQTLIREFKIPAPNVQIQKKIAAILSAYDDLIENNTRRIKILEEMAQAIYREWFVEFRAPGVKLRKATEEEKKVTNKDHFPIGWQITNIGNLLEYHVGGGWGLESLDSKHIQQAFVIRGTDIPRARYMDIDQCPSRYHKLSNYEARCLQPADMVFEVSGGSKDQPLGRALFVDQRLIESFDHHVICASFCKLVRTQKNNLNPILLYLHIQNMYENRRILIYQVQSTGISNFKWQAFLDNEKVVVPQMSVQNEFSNLASSLFETVSVLGMKNRNLRKTRDLLLPKLISGELDVSELDLSMAGLHELG